MPTKTENDELAQLRAKVKELEKKLERQKEEKREASGQKLADSVSDAGKRYRKEVAKVWKGYTLAYLEGLKLSSDSIAKAAGDVSSQLDSKKEEPATDVLKELPEHVSSGYSQAIVDHAEISQRMIDKFYETYSAADE